MKKRILSIVLTLCMVLMLVPATVFAEGGTTPTYDLWQVDGKVYYAEAGTRTDFSTADGGVELPDWINPECYQFPSSGTYVLQTDITLTSSRRMIQFTTPDTTLELNGKTVTCYGAGFSYISAENVTILDSVGEGTINGEVSFSDNCSLTLKSGTIYALNISGNSTFYADGGKIETVNEAYHATITQNNGTAGTEFNGFVNLKVGTFSGGVFYGLVGSGGGGGPFSCTISGGVFYGEVENKAKSTISDGVFYGTVVSGCGSNSCTISGGVFYGEVENKANSTISGGVFYGGIEDNGGTITDPYHTVSFDLNGASGTAPVTQYFVNTNTAQALEPAAPTREGYEFAGWYNGETKYDFTQNVTENITLKAKWESAKSPAFTGLEDGKTYCDTVQFEVSDNVGVASVTAGGVELSPTNGKYTLEKGIGTVTVVAIDKANNQTSVTVTVNNGHTDENKDHNCDFCNVTLSSHSGGQATYFKKAVCDYCKEEYGQLLTDSTAPTGEITVGTNKWNSFLNTITFGLFFKNTQSVAITATDDSYTHPGYTDDKAVKVEYLLSDKGLNKTDLASKEFTEYNSAFNINPDNKYVVYTRLTDHAGNVTYISSNGIVLDATAPVISGIENSKTYCEAQTVTVTEEYIESVKVNGTSVTLDANNQFTLNPAEGTQAIVATDKAGNVSAEMIVTVNDGHTDNNKDHNCDYCGVTLSKHSGGFSTCSSRAKCDYCGQYYGNLDLNWHHLEHIKAVPATESKTGNKEYWHCLDCGKYFADEKGTNEIKLDDTVIAKLPPEIIEGKGQSIVAGENKELSFTSNAAFGDFLRVELDGKTLDEKYYTVKEGSTIVTLKPDYVATLSAGKHTIGIVSESGTATTTFTINAKAVEDEKEMKSPETGNDGATALWIAFILSCGGVIVVTGAYSKRKNHI